MLDVEDDFLNGEAAFVRFLTVQPVNKLIPNTPIGERGSTRWPFK
jgi:hypothetical protein